MNIIERLELRLKNAIEKEAKRDVEKEAKLLKKQEIKKQQNLIKEAIKERDFVNAKRLVDELKHRIDIDKVRLPESMLV